MLSNALSQHSGKDRFDTHNSLAFVRRVIRFYAPFCKACKAFGIKFRKLATVRGDRRNAAGEVARHGDVRFGEIEYSSNVRLCKNLSIKTFPAVLIFRGGERGERLSEIVCKQTAIEDVIAEMDRNVGRRVHF